MIHSFLLFSKKLSTVMLLLYFSISLTVKAVTIYVNPQAQGANNGTSWNDAYHEVRDALNAANKGDEIWVTEGIYKPTNGNDYSATFQIKSGVQLYGGFKGTETQRDQRRWNVYITVLSGDLNGDDDINFSNCNDNVYHVVTGSSNATIDGFVIRGGYARGSDPVSSGAGMYNRDVTNLTIAHCTFTLNIADNAGGGIQNYRSSPNITSCIIIRNRAHFGAAIHNSDYSSPKVKNCILAINQATGTFPSGASGGAICSTTSSSTELINCTIQGNIASYGASISNYQNSSSTVRNCILWGGSGSGGNEIYNTSNSSVTISHTDIQNGTAGINGGTINIGSNIINADPAYIAYYQNDFRLTASSPCIDQANSAWAPADDIHGITRPTGAGPDIGACEFFEGTGIIYVDVDAQGANTGTSWNDAFTRLYNAIAEASDGRQIWVAEGTYYPRQYDNRLPSFYLKSGVILYGGFSGNETQLNDRSWTGHLTILSGNTNNENVYMILRTDGTNSVVVDGFTIQAGNGRTSCSYNSGASNLKIINCVFNGGYGHQGGAMYNEYCSVEINRCVFNGNSGNWGGAVHNYTQSNIKFINSVFYNNVATRYGGAICSWIGASVDLVNCTFYDNIVNAGENCNGGAIASGNGSAVSMINCILWSNSDQNGKEVWNSDNSSITLNYCDIEGGAVSITGGQINYMGNNINSLPRFINQANPQGSDNIFATNDDGLRLFRGSPCINTGTSNNAPAIDIVGNTRPAGSGYDIGAYEGGFLLRRCFCFRPEPNRICYCFPLLYFEIFCVMIISIIAYFVVRYRRKSVLTRKKS